jgi:hypothetical protein
MGEGWVNGHLSKVQTTGTEDWRACGWLPAEALVNIKIASCPLLFLNFSSLSLFLSSASFVL